jgi:hypothetical protein
MIKFIIVNKNYIRLKPCSLSRRVVKSYHKRLKIMTNNITENMYKKMIYLKNSILIKDSSNESKGENI